MRRRRAARVGFIASLLVAFALVLSGCWANVYDFRTGDRDITLTRDFSHRLIWSCTDAVGAGSPARDFCVLDRIDGVCRTLPEKGITEDDCLLLADYTDWQHLDSAIHHVIAASDCLTFFEAKDRNISDSFWGTASVGSLACK